MNEEIILALRPGIAFVVAIGASLLLPVLLVLFSRLGFGRGAPKRNLLAATICAPITALGISIVFCSTQVGILGESNSELATALLLYLTAAMVVYSAWSLIGYSFTLSVLIATCEVDEPKSVEKLAARFGGGHGLRAFLEDRLGVITGMGLIFRSQNRCNISGASSYRFASVVRLAMQIYAIREREGK